MKTSFLYSTAVLLLIGGSAAIAQSPDVSQKREESPRAQTPSAQSPAAHARETDRPAAADRMKERAQSEQTGGAKEMQRGEAPTPSERSNQAHEPQGRESKEPTRQGQDQPAQPGRERAPSSTAQQKDGQQGRDAKQSADQKQPSEEKLRGREGEPKQDRAQDTNKPADTKQQTQQQVDRDRKNQRDKATEPSGASTQQQTSRPGDTAPGQKTGQAPDQSNRQTSSATVNDDQRRQVVDQLRRDRAATSQNLNIQVNVGTRLPPRVQARRLPSDIVRIMPQYRDYEYTVIDNRVAIVDPRRREVVEILDDGPGYGGTAVYGRDRIVISDDTRTRFRELVRSSSTTVGSTSPSGGGTSASNCLSLQPVPEELARTHPELSSYRYLAIGDQVVLVDPQQQKIVQVID
jgi:Protein of unknown function (DUF1236)